MGYNNIETTPPSIKAGNFKNMYNALSENERVFYNVLLSFREDYANEINHINETLSENENGINIGEDAKMRKLIMVVKALLAAKLRILGIFDKHIDFSNSKIDIILNILQLIRELYKLGKENETTVDVTSQELIKEINKVIIKIKENEILG